MERRALFGTQPSTERFRLDVRERWNGAMEGARFFGIERTTSLVKAFTKSKVRRRLVETIFGSWKLVERELTASGASPRSFLR